MPIAERQIRKNQREFSRRFFKRTNSNRKILLLKIPTFSSSPYLDSLKPLGKRKLSALPVLTELFITRISYLLEKFSTPTFSILTAETFTSSRLFAFHDLVDILKFLDVFGSLKRIVSAMISISIVKDLSKQLKL